MFVIVDNNRNIINASDTPISIPPNTTVEINDFNWTNINASGKKILDSNNLVQIQPVIQSAPLDYSALRNHIVSLAQTAVGVTIDNLTANQRLALVACLLYSAGGLDPVTMAVKPLSTWLTDPFTHP